MSRERCFGHLALAALTTAAILPTLGEGLMLYDLGELVYFSDALLDGKVPGRDFAHNAYGPGRYLLLAGLWSIFGRSFDVIWGLFFVLRLGITAISWELSRRLVRGAWSWLPPLLLIAFPGPLHKGFSLLGTLLLALGLLSVTSRDAWHRPQPWLSLGWGAAALSFFRVDLGGFALLLGLALLVVTGAPSRRLVPLFAPMALGASLLAGVLLYLGGSEALIVGAGFRRRLEESDHCLPHHAWWGGAPRRRQPDPLPALVSASDLYSPCPGALATALEGERLEPPTARDHDRASPWSPDLQSDSDEAGVWTFPSVDSDALVGTGHPGPAGVDEGTRVTNDGHTRCGGGFLCVNGHNNDLFSGRHLHRSIYDS